MIYILGTISSVRKNKKITDGILTKDNFDIIDLTLYFNEDITNFQVTADNLKKSNEQIIAYIQSKFEKQNLQYKLEEAIEKVVKQIKLKCRTHKVYFTSNIMLENVAQVSLRYNPNNFLKRIFCDKFYML